MGGMMSVYIANTNILEVRGLQEAISGDYINNATVSVTIVNDCGAAISGQSWPLSMTYVATTNGDYRATISDAAQMIPGRNYFAEISANAGVNKIGFWRHRFRAVSRND
jgi:hypothetical protein